MKIKADQAHRQKIFIKKIKMIKILNIQIKTKYHFSLIIQYLKIAKMIQ